MAKRPYPGFSKTRLCPPLTIEQAAELYRCFLDDVFDIVRNIKETKRSISSYIAFSPIEAGMFFQEIAPDFISIPQVGSGLNERLSNAIKAAFDLGHDRVVAVNSDSPTLPESFLLDAFDCLDDTDVVLGPSEDGGYYLIGMKKPSPELIKPVKMSTTHVLADTLALAEMHNFSIHLLSEWYDVDTEKDLIRLRDDVDGTGSKTAGWFEKF